MRITNSTTVFDGRITNPLEVVADAPLDGVAHRKRTDIGQVRKIWESEKLIIRDTYRPQVSDEPSQ